MQSTADSLLKGIMRKYKLTNTNGTLLLSPRTTSKQPHTRHVPPTIGIITCHQSIVVHSGWLSLCHLVCGGWYC